MTKGQLLALDTPYNIKKQFGVGYKLMIEPKIDKIDMTSFGGMKQQFDAIILSEGNRQVGIQANDESTEKKLMYQVPFQQVVVLKELL